MLNSPSSPLAGVTISSDLTPQTSLEAQDRFSGGAEVQVSAVVVVVLAVSEAPGKSRSWQTHSAGAAGLNLLVVVVGNLGAVVPGTPFAGVVGIRVIAAAGGRSAVDAESQFVVGAAAAAAAESL